MGRTSTRMNKLEQRVVKIENEHKRLIDTQIVQLLQERNSPFSDKPRYTYDEISEMTGRSTGYISKLAQKHGLSRRNLTAL